MRSACTLLACALIAGACTHEPNTPPPAPAPARSVSPPAPPSGASSCPASGDGVTVLAERIEAGRITFDLYQATLTPESSPIVDAVAARLQACPALQIEIQVHTDTVRTGAFNARQSQRVAEVIRDRIAGAGVDAARLAACGYGESRPQATAIDWTQRSPNARVEWHVLAGPASAHLCPAIAP